MVTAVVLINVERKEVKKAINNLIGLDGITEVYTVAGEYDIVAIVRVKETASLSDLITDKIVHMPCIERTKTLFALDSYSDVNLEEVFMKA